MEFLSYIAAVEKQTRDVPPRKLLGIPKYPCMQLSRLEGVSKPFYSLQSSGTLPLLPGLSGIDWSMRQSIQ